MVSETTVLTMCASLEKFVFVLLSAILVYISSVECLFCVQCSSIDKQECIDGNIEPSRCKDANATFCVKYEGKVPDINIKLVVRECSPLDESSVCKVITMRGKQVDICFHSCTEDGCNGNNASTLTRVTIPLSIFTTFLMTLGYFSFGYSSLPFL